MNSPVFWEKNYQQGHLPWDLGGPTAVFQRLAASGQFVPGRLIVLGAGSGHDARLFARHGFGVTAVDFAEGAAQTMRALDNPDAPVDIRQADIFDLSPNLDGTFDYVLEYTCFCAIDPQRRSDYAQLVDRLLKLEGTYIVLAFPIWDRQGGPPFAVSPDEMSALFTAQGFQLQYREVPPDSAPQRRGLEELLIFRKSGSRERGSGIRERVVGKS